MVDSRSPQSPDRVLAQVPDTDTKAVATAATEARAAGREWQRGGAPARANALAVAAEKVATAAGELTTLMVDEVGKPVGEARGEAARGTGILRYFAQQALEPDGEMLPTANPRSLLYSRRRPHGVAGLITPWNFPVAIPLWKAAPAMAYGNAVLLKPAPEATAVALRLAELLDEAVPNGLLRVLPGDAETGQTLLENSDCVSFTGSVAVGHSVSVAAAQRGIPIQAEMGGLNASIVLSDADLDSAATSIAGASMGYAGQKCTATSRVIVTGDDRRQEQAREAFVAAVRNLGIGDPAEQGTAVGPVILEGACDAVVSAAEGARGDGGCVLTGGSRIDRSGWFVEPTVVADVPAGSQLLTDEVFGPIAAMQPARDVEEAVALNNTVRYGLVTSVYTRDLDRALGALDEIDTGHVRVNAQIGRAHV